MFRLRVLLPKYYDATQFHSACHYRTVVTDKSNKVTRICSHFMILHKLLD